MANDTKGGVPINPTTKADVAEANTHPYLDDLKAALVAAGVPTAHILDRHLVTLLNAGKSASEIVAAYSGYLAAGGGDDYDVFVRLSHDGGQDVKDALLGLVPLTQVTRQAAGASLQARTFALLAEYGATPQGIAAALGYGGGD